MRVHNLICAGTAGILKQRVQSARRRKRLPVTNVNRGFARVVCLLIVMSLLCNSTPVAAATIVGVSEEWSVSFTLWLQTSGSLTALKRLLAGEYWSNASAPQKQSDRNARVRRIRISPGEVTARIGEVVRFSAIARSEEHTSELQSQFHLVCR